MMARKRPAPKPLKRVRKLSGGATRPTRKGGGKRPTKTSY